HPPGNTEHGEKGPQLVRPDRVQNLPDDVLERAHATSWTNTQAIGHQFHMRPRGPWYPGCYFLSRADSTSPAFGELSRRYSLTRFRSSLVNVGATASRRRIVVATSST